ncbi:MAG: PQQ-binding-like beta-propeller repeat protein [Nanobdellota archaeon]
MKRVLSFAVEGIASIPCARDTNDGQELLVLDKKNRLNMLKPSGERRVIEFGRSGISQEEFLDSNAVVLNLPGKTTNEGQVILGLDDGRLLTIDRYGRILWRYRASGPVTTPLIHNGHVFAGTGDGVIALKDGRRLWHYPFGDRVLSLQRMILGDIQSLVLGCQDNWVYCLTMGGELRWKYKTKGMVLAQPQKYRNMVRIGSFDGNLYTLSSKGELVERRFLGSSIVGQTCLTDAHITVTQQKTYVDNSPLPFKSVSAPITHKNNIIFAGLWAVHLADSQDPFNRYKTYLLDHEPIHVAALRDTNKDYIVSTEKNHIHLLDISTS